MSVQIEIAGEALELLPGRGLFWGRDSVLMIADWHLGKAASFRAAGIGLPDGDLDEELLRLDGMLAQTGAGELLILGDLAHARAGLSSDLLGRIADWIAGAGIRVGLLAGNHDVSAGLNRASFPGIELLGERVERAPFVLQHAPASDAGGYVIAGHIHPAVRLGEGKRGGLRAPCFWFGEHAAVLPAFGGFTGGHRVEPADGDRIFAVGDGEVIEVPV